LLEGLVEPWGSRSDEGLVERDVGPVPIRAHRSMWHPGGTCLHLLGAAIARPQLPLRELALGRRERWACCTPWR